MIFHRRAFAARPAQNEISFEIVQKKRARPAGRAKMRAIPPCQRMTTTSPSKIPTPDEFRSAKMEARAGELFNPPGLSNFFGCLQTADDVLAIQHLTFAPYSMGEARLGVLAVNGCSLRASGLPVEYEWRPDRVTRRMRVGAIALESITVMGVREQSATVELRVTNTTSSPGPAHLRIQCGEGVIHSINNWKTPYSPRECPAISTTPWEGTPPPETLVRNHREPLPSGDGILHTSKTSVACAVQAASPAPDRVERAWLCFDWSLAAGETRALYFFAALGATPPDVLPLLDAWRRDPAAAIAAASADWTAEIEAVFTPGNTRYSGHLPLLETGDASLRALYLNAVIAAVYFKREHPLSAHGRVYTTLLPRYWIAISVINDWSLTALLLVMLDPECVRKQIELWLERDIYKIFGTEYVSGSNVGNWYSCNDYGMVRLITTWLRVTGRMDWLQTRAGGLTIREHLVCMAGHWRELDCGHGLADYGDRNSLLEAVGSYEHEVASLNAANVWMLREVALLLEHLGDARDAAQLRAEAAALIPEIQKLYVKGGGYWHCRQPDGSLVPARHIWDFIHVLNFLHEDLPDWQVAEMVDFFERELMTPHWLAALSPLDEDAGFSLRPDHQWNGSYPAWVALAAAALVRTNRVELLRKWLPGLARTAAQGPLSQAHLVENFAPLSGGGARKAPTEWPYITDWTVICAGSFFDFIVGDVFGFNPGYDASAPAQSAPRPGLAGPQATLRNVPCRGKLLCLKA